MTHAPHKVLVLSPNYPNNVLPTLGPWVQRLVRHAHRYAEHKVVPPIPYCLPLIPEEFNVFIIGRCGFVIARGVSLGIKPGCFFWPHVASPK